MDDEELRGHFEGRDGDVCSCSHGDDVLALLDRLEAAEAHLQNLLAVIHRDGGHHTTEVGLEQSVEDAKAAWYAAERENARLGAELQQRPRIISVGTMPPLDLTDDAPNPTESTRHTYVAGEHVAMCEGCEPTGGEA